MKQLLRILQSTVTDHFSTQIKYGDSLILIHLYGLNIKNNVCCQKNNDKTLMESRYVEYIEKVIDDVICTILGSGSVE